MAGCASLCQTPDEGLASAIDALEPETPPFPEMEPIHFEDKANGLWLSYDAYRALDRNMIALYEHFENLKAVIEYYRGKK